MAIIPDGNRRWAVKRGAPSFIGHRRGAANAEQIIDAALRLGVTYVTFWGCSIDNLTKRDSKEVKFLMKIFGDYFKKLLADKQIHKDKIHIEILGEWRRFFSERDKGVMERLISETKMYAQKYITFLMAYSGTEEMVNAFEKVRSSYKTGRIDGAVIKRSLLTKDLPAVDLVIRTGGEPHWSSGFMMWDIRDAQMYFTRTLWPAFSVGELKKAIGLYSDTKRRLGG